MRNSRYLLCINFEAPYCCILNVNARNKIAFFLKIVLVEIPILISAKDQLPLAWVRIFRCQMLDGLRSGAAHVGIINNRNKGVLEGIVDFDAVISSFSNLLSPSCSTTSFRFLALAWA